MPGTIVELKLYDQKDEAIKTCQRPIIPWGILKRAVKLSREIDQENLKEEDVDLIAALVVEIFDGQVTLDELDKYADVSDMIAVINMIVTKASRSMKLDAVNPT
jgi:hypothetical protein